MNLILFFSTAKEEKPSAEVTPDAQEVKEGQAATFYCKIEGYPEPQIEWRRGM